MIKLLNTQQIREIDRLTLQKLGISKDTLIEQVGVRITKTFVHLFEKDKKVVVVCGKGDNGRDGFALAKQLLKLGYFVAVCKIDAEMDGDGVPQVSLCELNEFDIVVDAIFGIELSCRLVGAYASMIHQINSLHKVIVSIDIPSGIDANTGAKLGSAIKADYTLSIQTGKVGLYVYPGREYSGKVCILDIDIPESFISTIPSDVYLIQKEAMGYLLPQRAMHSNKGSYGKVLCIGGSEEMSGSITLASLAAIRSGCGSITCAIPRGILARVTPVVLESMYILLDDEDGHIASSSVSVLSQRIANYTCILVGCGITRSDAIPPLLKVLLDSDIPLVIDADGLYALIPLLSKYKKRKQLILTPHLKEFARLVGKNVEDIVEHQVEEALLFSKEYPNVVLVLKSETTLIVCNQQLYINTYGNNGLAKGGSGDVLAGIITGLYAQNKDALSAAILGVFLHAYSADRLLKKHSVYSILPSDILGMIDNIVKELEDSV